MLKLNASFSKKVPAEGDYSSKSYHASIESELPDGLTEPQLRERIHGAFELVRSAVEAELGAPAPRQGAPGGGSAAHVDCASAKQLKYLLDLGRLKGLTPAELAARAGARSVDGLTRQQCSKLIDELGRKAA
jgi:hypothetical protein